MAFKPCYDRSASALLLLLCKTAPQEMSLTTASRGGRSFRLSGKVREARPPQGLAVSPLPLSTARMSRGSLRIGAAVVGVPEHPHAIHDRRISKSGFWLVIMSTMTLGPVKVL
jgi:hypothetical protein